MQRREFLRGIMGLTGATVGALALAKGVDARDVAPESIPGRLVGGGGNVLTTSDGTRWASADPIITIAGPFGGTGHTSVPRGTFPEYDPAYPVVTYHGADGVMESEVKSLTVRPTGDGGEVWELRTIISPVQDTMVHTTFHPDGTASVLPSWDALPPDEMHHMMAIPRAAFPEFDPTHGIVDVSTIADKHAPVSSDAWALPLAIRAAYAEELAWRRDLPYFQRADAMRADPSGAYTALLRS